MPILASGTFTAVILEPPASLLRTKPAAFEYAPLNLILWALLLAAHVCAVWLAARRDRSYPLSRHVILLPAVIGLAWVFALDSDAAVLGSLPLQTLTAAFVLWRVLKIRQWWAGALLAYSAAVVVAAWNLFAAGAFAGRVPAFLLLFVDLIIGAFAAVIVALPIIALRVAIEGGVTPPRLGAALLIGALFPFVAVTGILVVAEMLGASDGPGRSDYAANLLFWGAPAVLFALFVRRNDWARAVATGEMFRPPPSAG